MFESEIAMVRQLTSEDEKPEERFTSLQPTYEDSVQPEAEDDWDDRD